MEKANRGQLLRWAKEGKLLGATSYYYDADFNRGGEQIIGKPETADWRPVKIIAHNDEWEDGKFNLREYDFKSSVGFAKKVDKNVYSLYIHSNHSVFLKKK